MAKKTKTKKIGKRARVAIAKDDRPRARKVGTFIAKKKSAEKKSHKKVEGCDACGTKIEKEGVACADCKKLLCRECQVVCGSCSKTFCEAHSPGHACTDEDADVAIIDKFEEEEVEDLDDEDLDDIAEEEEKEDNDSHDTDEDEIAGGG